MKSISMLVCIENLFSYENNKKVRGINYIVFFVSKHMYKMCNFDCGLNSIRRANHNYKICIHIHKNIGV